MGEVKRSRELKPPAQPANRSEDTGPAPAGGAPHIPSSNRISERAGQQAGLGRARQATLLSPQVKARRKSVVSQAVRRTAGPS